MKKINCLIVDDEPLACKGLAEYMDDIDPLHLVAMVHNPADALKYLPEVDLMYLDINMPKISGIDFLKLVKNPPLTIITTAYQQYALQGYELDVVDYLLKPISFPRFLKATTKAIDYLRLRNQEKSKQPEAEVNDYFFVKCNGILEKVMMADILAIESLANYITIHCTERKMITYLTLKQIKEYLPSTGFVQVHKSFIVAAGKIDKIDHNEIVLQKLRVPIGQNFKEAVAQQVTGGKIWKR